MTSSASIQDSYAEFLARKHGTVPSFGFDCRPEDLDGSLFGFQRHITAWAVRRARAAVFADIPGAMDVPEIVVLNKADIADPEVVARLRSREVHAVLVSAHTGEGVDELRALIADQLPRPGVAVDVVVPYHRGDLVSRVHEHGDIDHEEHTEHGTVLRARVDAQLAAELQAASVA